MDDACIASNCRSSKTVQRYKLFRVNQSTCTVENLLRNVENDVEQTIPNPSELPIRMIPVTETVSNTHNVIRFDIEESKSNELLETPTKSSVLRFDEIIIILIHWCMFHNFNYILYMPCSFVITTKYYYDFTYITDEIRTEKNNSYFLILIPPSTHYDSIQTIIYFVFFFCDYSFNFNFRF